MKATVNFLSLKGFARAGGPTPRTACLAASVCAWMCRDVQEPSDLRWALFIAVEYCLVERYFRFLRAMATCSKAAGEKYGPSTKETTVLRRPFCDLTVLAVTQLASSSRSVKSSCLRLRAGLKGLKGRWPRSEFSCVMVMTK